MSEITKLDVDNKELVRLIDLGLLTPKANESFREAYIRFKNEHNTLRGWT